MKILDNPALKDYELDEGESIVYVPLVRDDSGVNFLKSLTEDAALNVFMDVEEAIIFAKTNANGNEVALQECLLRDDELLFQDKIIKYVIPPKH